MRILAMFSAAFAAAAALCAYALPAAWCWLPGLCLAALAAVLLFLHGDPIRRVRTIALGLAAGFLWCWADAGRLVSVRALCGEGQTIEAEVCSLPERTQYGYRCVTLLQGNRMQLYLRNAPEDAALGDRVRVTAEQMRDWARIMDIEYVHIGADTTVESLEHDLFLSDLAWKLK